MRTPNSIEKVKRKLADSPYRSSKRLSRELQLSRTTVRRILVDDLNLFSYKIQILQKQSTVQKEKRLTFGKLVAGKVEKKEIDIGNINCSDEAHFQLSGYVNKQNMRIWGEEKPDPLDSKL
ncbi:Histone-lysine N-methyltransferase SETMAR-like [Oopsacas minuta]|uniref:Histone-lysine N-methyltransferase SETMAR-like n=1 Tax=Oopsacas minuta TaxID=111878 RepID=A0AAV7JM20_9METZ|nr:Histone-lysine N-methyltransferase SETMAR-like [Oopsacas minuta]